MSLAQRSITSTSWNVVANSARIVVLFARSLILARLLPTEVFGVYTGAGAVVGLTVVACHFGLAGAFIHRAPETEDEDEAAAVHFTLKLVLLAVWVAVLLVGAMLLATGQTRTVLMVLTLATAGQQLAQTPRLILVRRVVHRRLALIDTANAVVTSALAVWLALHGATLWALLATDVARTVLTLVGLYLWRPVWRPRLSRSRPVLRYFVGFGSRTFLATALYRALDRVDDIWTWLYLGDGPQGLYSRSYTFATYPRRILAVPVNAVAGGTYAELKGDRPRLSMAFFRTNALLVRAGFLLGGLLVLVAPEFIRLGPGVKWLPMLDAFRLMLVFTLLDPIKVTVGDLFVTMGRPELATRARLVQLAVLVAGMFALGPRLGITGVALAVDLMLVVGIGVLLWQARAFVDFSIVRLMGVPSLALALALAAGLAAGSQVIGASDWVSGSVKALAFGAVYVAVSLALERRDVVAMARYVRRVAGGPGPAL